MHIEELVSAQRAYYAMGLSKPYEKRIQSLSRLYRAVVNREDEIKEALRADLGRAGMESYMVEIGMVREELRYCMAHLSGWMRAKSVPTPLAQFPSTAFVRREPYGVVLIMAPWNYPLLLNLQPLIGAICGGNCAILKPSAYAPATSHLLADLIGGLFVPEYVTVVEGGRNENAALLDEKFDKIFFTGSTAVGRLVLEKAAVNLTPVSLELGGKSPAVVDRTANLRVAARRIAFGKFLNAGQTCVAPDYVLVEQCVREPFMRELKLAVNRFFPREDYAEFPRIVNEKHFDRLRGLVQNETALTGGICDRSRLFFAPTVLDSATWESPVMQEEIFGPILPVLTFKTADEAISAINARPKPLAFYLFTENRAAEKKFLGGCSFGGGCINDTIVHLSTPRLGFGGVGESGMGNYHGRHSFDAFTHEVSVLRKGTWLDLPMRYHPYSAAKEAMVRLFLH